MCPQSREQAEAQSEGTRRPANEEHRGSDTGFSLGVDCRKTGGLQLQIKTGTATMQHQWFFMEGLEHFRLHFPSDPLTGP